MSVPTKTGVQWLEDYRNISSKSELALFLSQRWVLLEDNQKALEDLKAQLYSASWQKNNQTARAYAISQLTKEGWLSPRQQERFIGIFNDFISEYEELIVRGGKSIALEVVVSELKTLRECFGVLFNIHSPKSRDLVLEDKDKPSQVVVSESPSERVSKNSVGVFNHNMTCPFPNGLDCTCSGDKK